jgi:hypothetical protein
MPMVPDPAGALPFIAIKLAGYTAFGAYLNQAYGKLRFPAAEAARPLPNAITVGVCRTILGIAAGIVYSVALSAMVENLAPLGVLVALAPLRLGEWLFLICILYDRKRRYRDLLLKRGLQGVAVSYLLDLPAFGIWSFMPGVPWC